VPFSIATKPRVQRFDEKRVGLERGLAAREDSEAAGVPSPPFALDRIG
jgi:hypothetical protein